MLKPSGVRGGGVWGAEKGRFRMGRLEKSVGKQVVSLGKTRNVFWTPQNFLKKFLGGAKIFWRPQWSTKRGFYGGDGSGRGSRREAPECEKMWQGSRNLRSGEGETPHRKNMDLEWVGMAAGAQKRTSGKSQEGYSGFSVETGGPKWDVETIGTQKGRGQGGLTKVLDVLGNRWGSKG